MKVNSKPVIPDQRKETTAAGMTKHPGETLPLTSPKSKFDSPFKGESKLSKLLDAFVCMHCGVAFLFASVMLFYPEAFGLFTKESVPDLAKDAIRWACPFVYGFSLLAFLSMSFSSRDRVKVAQLFVASFSLATIVGIVIQSSGRWNSYHPINIALFASLAVGYSFFICYRKGAAFYR